MLKRIGIAETSQGFYIFKNIEITAMSFQAFQIVSRQPSVLLRRKHKVLYKEEKVVPDKVRAKLPVC